MKKLKDYYQKNVYRSAYSMVPIELIDCDEIKALKESYVTRVRYRGPRRKVDNPGHPAHGKISYSGQLTCLKEDATHFTFYVECVKHPKSVWTKGRV